MNEIDKQGNKGLVRLQDLIISLVINYVTWAEKKYTFIYESPNTQGFFQLDGQGRGILMEAPRPPPIKVLVSFLSEVVEAKRGC